MCFGLLLCCCLVAVCLLLQMSLLEMANEKEKMGLGGLLFGRSFAGFRGGDGRKPLL